MYVRLPLTTGGGVLTSLSVDLCPLLKHLFSPDLKCSSISDSFSSPPILSERFTSSSTFQYFYPLPRLLDFQKYVARTICEAFKGPCVNEAASLSYASSIDIDFDAISHAVTVAGYWRTGQAKTEPRKWKEGDSLEVGVLQAEKPEEPEELKLGGYLTVLGEDEKPSTSSKLKRESLALLTRRRSDALLLSFSAPSSPSLITRYILHALPATHRPAPKARNLLPSPASHAAKGLLCSTCLPHPPLSLVHRPLPTRR